MRAFVTAVVLFCASIARADALPFVFIQLIDAYGHTIASFRNCAQIGSSNDIISFRSGGGGGEMKIPGAVHVGDVVCTRGFTGDAALWNWRQAAAEGQAGFRKNGKLRLVDSALNFGPSWTFSNGWLSKIVYDAATETIVLTSDQLNRDGLSLVPTITWTPQSLTYGQLLGADQLNATTTAAGTLTYDPPAGTLLNAGTHTLHVTFTPADPAQFTPATFSVNVVVNPAVLTATADNKSKTFGQPNPSLTFTLSGFVNGETAAVVTGAPALMTTATTTSDAGEYAITIAKGSLIAANYTFQLVNGKLTINKATPVFSDLTSLVIAKGTPSTTLSGRTSAPAGEAVVITLNGTPHSAAVQPDGTFSSAFATGALVVSATPYLIAYSYSGDRNFNAISGTGALTVAYLNTFTGTTKTPGIDDNDPGRPFRAKFSLSLNGSIPGDFTAFVNYAPAAPGPNVTSIVSDGTWKLHAENKKPLPKGIVSGRITGGVIQWNGDGTIAKFTLQMTIDSGNGDFANIKGTAEIRNGVWTATTISGQLLLFY